MNDLISVIIPVYNVEKYLRECLDSVLAQTYTNLEILLVDDGSTDGSGAICDEYAGKDSRIRVIHQENGGLSAARNAGLRAAKGSYIEFVDSDDWIDRNLLKSQMDAIQQHHVSIAATTIHLEEETPSCQSIVASGTDIFLRSVGSDSIKINGWFFWSACGRLFDAALLEGLYFPEGVVNEDVDFTPKVFFRADSVCIMDTGMYFYRNREGSITGRNHLNVHADLIIVLSRLLQYAEQNQIVPDKVFMCTIKHLYLWFRMLVKGEAVTSDDFMSKLREYLKTHYWRMMRSNDISLPIKLRFSELVLFNSTRLPFRKNNA